MNAYKYQIKRTGGQMQVGVLKAESQMIATQEARALGGTLVELVRIGEHEAQADGLMARLNGLFGNGVNSKELLAFSSQLAVMAKAGIGLTTALDSIAEQITTKGMGNVVRTLKTDVEAGRQFSEALQRFPKVFSVLYVNMVRASELTGSFGHMLERITEYLTQQAETKRQVVGAMVYPLIIVSMAITTTIFMLVFVLPRFMVLFKGHEDILPLPTKILMAASASLTGFWYLYIVAVIGFAIGSYYFLKTEYGRTWWDMAKLKIPILKNLCHALYLSRGLRTMGELVNAGVPMLDTIAITAEVSGNIHYARIWQRVHLAIRKGQRIAPTLSRSAFIPVSVAQMISAGEETGTLAEILKDVSEFYDKQLKATILLPIFKMSQLVK
jgi:type IV pilus assembly protein PilC